MISEDPALLWDCSECRASALADARNCNVAAGNRYVTKTGLSFDRCPKAWMQQEAWRESLMVSDALAVRSLGVLPRAGGILDQEATFLESLRIVDRQSVLLAQQVVPDGQSIRR